MLRTRSFWSSRVLLLMKKIFHFWMFFRLCCFVGLELIFGGHPGVFISHSARCFFAVMDYVHCSLGSGGGVLWRPRIKSCSSRVLFFGQGSRRWGGDISVRSSVAGF